MIKCGSHMFQLSVNKEMEKIKKSKWKIPTYLLAFQPSADERIASMMVGRHPSNRKSNEIHASQEGRWVYIEKVTSHLCILTSIVKELKISVEQGKVVTTLNIIKH
jgi:hypothetical protein